MTADYQQLRLDISGFNPDILSTVLFQNGASRIEEVSEQIWFVFFPPDFEERKFSTLFNQLLELNPSLNPEQFFVSTIPNQDWNSEWKKHFQPIKIGKSVCVLPAWEQPGSVDFKYIIKIEPQMAFGTGSHETTQLMIEAMENYLKPGMRILDAGTGSGILALLASKMGCGEIDAFDNDPDALENAKFNAKINEAENIQFHVNDGSTLPEKKYDAILANITRNILLDLLPAFLNRLASNGIIILSGIQTQDEAIIKNAFPADFDFPDTGYKKEWIAVSAKLKGETDE